MAVVEYTLRRMTSPRDKLLALSAVAQGFAKYLNNVCGVENPVYLAGLWKHELATSLCWHAGDDPRLPRPEECRAPS